MNNCKYCNKEIPMNAVQQGGCHLACFDEWFNREMVVWRVEHDGISFLEDKPGNLGEFFREIEEGDHYSVTKTKIKQGEFEALEEFTGF